MGRHLVVTATATGTLNRAIHAIALTRMRSCARTRAYVARRTAEGKTIREIRRCSSATSRASSTGNSPDR